MLGGFRHETQYLDAKMSVRKQISTRENARLFYVRSFSKLIISRLKLHHPRVYVSACMPVRLLCFKVKRHTVLFLYVLARTAVYEVLTRRIRVRAAKNKGK